MTRDELQKRIDGAIAKCIRNDYAFGSYAHEVTEVVWPVLEAAEKERDELRAKIAEMEKQEPVAAQQRFQRQQEMMAVWLPWQTTELRKGRPARTVDVLGLNVEYRELYALPGAQPQLNEIRTALQRALELGQREAWTGARKHRSWVDQREEQQCWNKVWSLLGAQGEEK